MKSMFVVAVTVAALSAGVGAQAVPTGFTDEGVVSSGLTLPTAMAFLPDGRMLITEQGTASNLKVWIGSGAPVAVGTVAGVSNAGGNERGLLGLAVDPQWPARPYIYLWHNRVATGGVTNMVLCMYTVTGQLTNAASSSLALGNRYDIITDVPDNAYNHNGGSVRFGPDGMLYVSMGEDADACNAQVIGSFKGCILRLDVSQLPGVGAGPPAKTVITPAGNPFTTPLPNGPLVWAYGLRNPFRFHIDPVTGWLMVADVGQSTLEEIDCITQGGGNYGWPWMEGTLTYNAGCGGSAPAGLIGPIATMSAASGAHAIMSMDRYRNPAGPAPYAFGAAYEGDYFYTDYYLGALRRMHYNGTSWVAAAAVAGQPNSTDWGTGFTNVTDAARGTDGALYYVKQSPASVRRIKGTANAPVMACTAGNNQVSNAGTVMLQPIQFRLTQQGNGVGSTLVTFTVTTGAGTFASNTGTTDATGYVTCLFTPGTASSANPVITATGFGASGTANVTWRGLTVVVSPTFHLVTATMRHSEVNSAITLAVDAPVGSPFFGTIYGDVWTSIFTPPVTCIAFDGLGLLGAPDPNVHTLAAQPTWTLTINNLPTYGNLMLTCQGYAIDNTRWPNDDAFVVTNRVNITLP